MFELCIIFPILCCDAQVQNQVCFKSTPLDLNADRFYEVLINRINWTKKVDYNFSPLCRLRHVWTNYSTFFFQSAAFKENLNLLIIKKICFRLWFVVSATMMTLVNLNYYYGNVGSYKMQMTFHASNSKKVNVRSKSACFNRSIAKCKK